MLKLIRLEIKKFKLLDYWKGILIANFAIISFLIMIFLLEKNDGNIAFESFDLLMSIINASIRATFLIFSSVILVKLIIDEYKNKSIDIMFTYPINRKKIMLAKLLIVVVFTFVTIMLSTLFIGGLFYWGDSVFNIVPGEISNEELTGNVVAVFMGALASAGLCLIPLFFGMRRKSPSATIVSSIFLVSLTNSTGNNFTLYSIIAIPLTLGLIGLLIGYLSIRNIEKVDIR